MACPWLRGLPVQPLPTSPPKGLLGSGLRGWPGPECVCVCASLMCVEGRAGLRAGNLPVLGLTLAPLATSPQHNSPTCLADPTPRTPRPARSTALKCCLPPSTLLRLSAEAVFLCFAPSILPASLCFHTQNILFPSCPAPLSPKNKTKNCPFSGRKILFDLPCAAHFSAPLALVLGAGRGGLDEIPVEEQG